MEEVKADLQAVANAILSVTGGSSTQEINSTVKTVRTVRMRIEGDVIEGTGGIDTEEEVKAFLKGVPSSLEKINEGKGRPVKYVLTETDEIVRDAGVENDPKFSLHNRSRSINSTILRQVRAKMVEEIEVQQTVKQYQAFILKYKECFQFSALKTLEQQAGRVYNMYNNFVTTIESKLREYRASILNETEFSNLLDSWVSIDTRMTELQMVWQNKSTVVGRILASARVYDEFVQYHVPCLANTFNPRRPPMHSSLKPTYIFRYNDKLLESSPSLWYVKAHVLLTLAESTNSTLKSPSVFITNCDFAGSQACSDFSEKHDLTVTKYISQRESGEGNLVQNLTIIHSQPSEEYVIYKTSDVKKLFDKYTVKNDKKLNEFGANVTKAWNQCCHVRGK